MYGNEKKLAMYESAGQQLQRANMTVEENINSKIAQLQGEISRLEASKQSLSPLLKMKLGDIHEAMNY